MGRICGRPWTVVAPRLGRKGVAHYVGDVGPDAEFGEVGVDEGVHGKQADDGQRLYIMTRAETDDMSANADNVDHYEIPQIFPFCCSRFLHASVSLAREMRLRPELI